MNSGERSLLLDDWRAWLTIWGIFLFRNAIPCLLDGNVPEAVFRYR